MSILGSIMSGIFGTSANAEAVPPNLLKPDVKPEATPAMKSVMDGKPAAAMAPATVATAMPKAGVDIAANLDTLANAVGKDLDWRKSIVDLMKILKLDSSFAARKKLAEELRYTGSTKNSAEMNMWLHKQVMTKLVENGGKLPGDVLHS